MLSKILVVMRNVPILNVPTVEINDQHILLVTKGLIEDYIFLKEQQRRTENITKVCNKERALEILGCSESSLYRKMRKRNCKIRKGSVNGTFLVSSLYDELEN